MAGLQTEKKHGRRQTIVLLLSSIAFDQKAAAILCHWPSTLTCQKGTSRATEYISGLFSNLTIFVCGMSLLRCIISFSRGSSSSLLHSLSLHLQNNLYSAWASEHTHTHTMITVTITVFRLYLFSGELSKILTVLIHFSFVFCPLGYTVGMRAFITTT